jgi:hypothetical protein
MQTEKTLSLEQEVLLAFEMRYKGSLYQVGMKVQKLMGEGLDMNSEIWNGRCQVELVNTAKYYTEYFLVKSFYDGLYS